MRRRLRFAGRGNRPHGAPLEGYAPHSRPQYFTLLSLNDPISSSSSAGAGLCSGGVGLVVLLKVLGEPAPLPDGVTVAEWPDCVGRAREDAEMLVFLSGVFLDGWGRGLCVLGRAARDRPRGRGRLLLVESRIFCVEGGASLGSTLSRPSNMRAERSRAEINPNEVILHLGQMWRGRQPILATMRSRSRRSCS